MMNLVFQLLKNTCRTLTNTHRAITPENCHQLSIPQNRIVHIHFNAIRCFPRFINNSMPPSRYFLLQLANTYDQIIDTKRSNSCSLCVFISHSLFHCYLFPNSRASIDWHNRLSVCMFYRNTPILKSSKKLYPCYVHERRDSIAEFVICVPET